MKRTIRIGEKEHVRSELMNTNGNADSIWKIINRYVRLKTHNLSVCWFNLQWKPRQQIPRLLPSTENCQFQPCSPIKKFGLSLRKYDHIPKGLNSLGWLDIPYKLNFNDCEIMYKCLNILTTLQNTFLKKSFQIQNITARHCENLNTDWPLDNNLSWGQALKWTSQITTKC